MLVRWLGAFGQAKSLSAAFEFELHDTAHKCAEPIAKGGKPRISRPKVGLLVRGSALVRRFRGDVWSMPNTRNPRRLKATRGEDEAPSSHREAWVRPEYCGIVLKSRNVSHGSISQCALRTIWRKANEYNLPVYRLTRSGTLEEVILMTREK